MQEYMQVVILILILIVILINVLFIQLRHLWHKMLLFCQRDTICNIHCQTHNACTGVTDLAVHCNHAHSCRIECDEDNGIDCPIITINGTIATTTTLKAATTVQPDKTLQLPSILK